MLCLLCPMLVGASILLTEGCGMRNTMTFHSPSRKARVEVWQTQFDNFLQARVDLVNGTRRTVLYTQPSDAGIYFFHVYWSPHETKVGIFASGAGFFEAAARVDSGEQIPFAEIRQELELSIRETYHVREDEVKDVLGWAKTGNLVDQFFARHPEIRVTYRSH